MDWEINWSEELWFHLITKVILFTILRILFMQVKILLVKLRLYRISLSSIQRMLAHLEWLFGLKEFKEVKQTSKELKPHLTMLLKICSLYHHILRKIIWFLFTTLKRHIHLILTKYQKTQKSFVKDQFHVSIFFLQSKFVSTQPDSDKDQWK